MNLPSPLSCLDEFASSRKCDKTAIVFAPHAGGSASAFAPVRVRLLECMDFIGARYPGRCPDRISQSPRTVYEMAACVITAVDAHAASASRGLTLWGYSLGALVVWEAARRLVQRGWPRVDRVVVAACRPPHLFSTRHIPAHACESEFLEAVKRLGGLPLAALNNPQWLAHAMPVLRADFLVCERYRCDDAMPLPVPLMVMSGAGDELAPAAQMREWRRYSTVACDEYTFTGGHFFVHEHAAHVAAIIACGARPLSHAAAA